MPLTKQQTRFPRHITKLKRFKITDRKLFPRSYGLYFVVTKHWRILYIGKTIQPFNERWYGHDRYEQAKRCNAYIVFWPCKLSDSRLRDEETEAIDYHSPKWNGTPIKNYFWIDLIQLIMFGLCVIGLLTYWMGLWPITK